MSRLLSHVSKSRPVFFCCDLQDKFKASIPRFNDGVYVANRFLRFSQLFPQDTMYIATQHYPKGLGKLAAEIGLEQPLQQSPDQFKVFDKTLFSMLTPEVKELLGDRENVVIFGIEAHVCILQTIEELVQINRRVYVAIDGTHSSREEDRTFALQTAQSFGGNVVLGSSESILLQLIRDASDPNFKAVSALLREKLPSLQAANADAAH